uniref:Uncharacterized protein n=1 Tax=Candidozyma auris TaxID=498019 RepID=A0A0L0P3S7_CANAR
MKMKRLGVFADFLGNKSMIKSRFNKYKFLTSLGMMRRASEQSTEALHHYVIYSTQRKQIPLIR